MNQTEKEERLPKNLERTWILLFPQNKRQKFVKSFFFEVSMSLES